MKDFLITLAGVYCILCTLIVTSITLRNLAGGGIITGVYIDQLKECEATLPRDQHCVLIAVPEGEAK